MNFIQLTIQIPPITRTRMQNTFFPHVSILQHQNHFSPSASRSALYSGGHPPCNGYQTFVARIYPQHKTKNRCPRLQEGWDKIPALPKCSMNPAQRSPTVTSWGIPAQDCFPQTAASQGQKIVWGVTHMGKSCQPNTNTLSNEKIICNWRNRCSSAQLPSDLQSGREEKN